MPPRKALPPAGRDAALAKVDSIPLKSIDDLTSLGEVFVRSGLFTDARDAAKAMVKILAGRELGMAPFASMTGVNIIQGKPALSANIMAAAIQRSGTHRFTVTKMADDEVAIAFFEKVDGEWISCGPDSTFAEKDAMKAGLAFNAMHKKFPRNMKYARALSNGARWYCAGVFGGPVYVPEELGAVVNEEGEIINVPSTVVDIPTKASFDPAAGPVDVGSHTAPAEASQRILDTMPTTLPAVDADFALHDAVADIVAILDKDYASWRKRDIWTKQFFGEALTDEAALLAFAKAHPRRWEMGRELIWEQK